MRRPATMRRVPRAPTDEGFFIRLATDALMGVMTDLRRRVEHKGTRRSVAQVLLAEAHIDEAIGLLKAIQSMPRMRESHELRPYRHAGRRLQQAGRPRLHVVFRPAKQ